MFVLQVYRLLSSEPLALSPLNVLWDVLYSLVARITRKGQTDGLVFSASSCHQRGLPDLFWNLDG